MRLFSRSPTRTRSLASTVRHSVSPRARKLLGPTSTAATWQPGRAQPSYDKQFVRDYLETLAWDKNPPAPALPADVAVIEDFVRSHRR